MSRTIFMNDHLVPEEDARVTRIQTDRIGNNNNLWVTALVWIESKRASTTRNDQSYVAIFEVVRSVLVPLI